MTYKLVGEAGIPVTMPLSLGIAVGIACGADAGSTDWDKFALPLTFKRMVIF